MMKKAFQYNLIRFQPDAETGEFANVGVLVFSEADKQLVFHLLTREHYPRLTAFFSPLSEKELAGALDMMATELQRVETLLPNVANPTFLYEELTRPREDVIRFAPTGMIMGDDAQACATDLFQRYIERLPLAA